LNQSYEMGTRIVFAHGGLLPFPSAVACATRLRENRMETGHDLREDLGSKLP